MKYPKFITAADNLKGRIVLLRLDLNVPIENGHIKDDFRIRRSIPTIKYLKKAGAKVVIISHIGRSKTDSLKPVARYMNKYVKTGFLPDDVMNISKDVISDMRDGSVVVLENVRFYPGEEKNGKIFAKKLALLGDIYVNDAFPASHRKHASIIGLPLLLPSYMGFLMKEEIDNLSIARTPKRPFLFILGGAKFKTKIPLIKKYLSIADYVFVGGALANVFLKFRGFHMESSYIEDVDAKVKVFLNNRKLLLPEDALVLRGKKATSARLEDIRKTDKVVDAGPETIISLENIIKSANTIILNGPLGYYEYGFDKASKKILRAIASSEAMSVVGGGDTAYLARGISCDNKNFFISTGGGAMIDFFINGTLPGIEALL